MTLVAKPGQICQKLTPESVVGLVVYVQIEAASTGLTFLAVGVPVPLAYQLPLRALDIRFVFLSEFEHVPP